VWLAGLASNLRFPISIIFPWLARASPGLPPARHRRSV